VLIKCPLPTKNLPAQDCPEGIEEFTEAGRVVNRVARLRQVRFFRGYLRFSSKSPI